MATLLSVSRAAELSHIYLQLYLSLISLVVKCSGGFYGFGISENFDELRNSDGKLVVSCLEFCVVI